MCRMLQCTYHNWVFHLATLITCFPNLGASLMFIRQINSENLKLVQLFWSFMDFPKGQHIYLCACLLYYVHVCLTQS